MGSDNYILSNAKKIEKIPGIIIQGRYDMVCPPNSANKLKNVWPKSELKIVKSDSRFLNNPSLISLNKEKKRLLVRKDFNERKWIDPQKILMAITPGFFLVCLAAPPAVFGALTLLYLI